ncbi:MAG: Holliday junction branch migration protein RuvA [Candidatus Nealsonbacteria bacterium]|nr:Holliday junction branch migration protein RuvA [Candidatus Nealsonbacteria bacterium]
MIYSLAGKITYKDDRSLILENQGVGYKVFCSPSTLRNVPGSQEIRIFTHLHLREDAIELYGFLNQEELELFGTLNEISGIGPKTAMMLASLGSLEKLKEIMESGKLPPEIKGIGQKRMQKILLELTGKIKDLKKPAKINSADGATEALVSLGFSRQKAQDALAKIPGELPREERIKTAIKILGRS